MAILTQEEKLKTERFIVTSFRETKLIIVYNVCQHYCCRLLILMVFIILISNAAWVAKLHQLCWLNVSQSEREKQVFRPDQWLELLFRKYRECKFLVNANIDLNKKQLTETRQENQTQVWLGTGNHFISAFPSLSQSEVFFSVSS